MKEERFHRCARLAPLAAVVIIGSISAHAGMIVSISPVTIAAGTIAASLDVNIQNTGPSVQNIASFFLALSVVDTHITFTGGNESTALTYLLNGDSFDVLTASSYTSTPPPNGQTVQASDLSFSGAGTTMASSTTLGLGHILFNVAGNTPAGPINVTVAPSCAALCTSLSDSAGANVPFSVTNGTITVTAATVPEPSTLLLALLALPAIAWKRLRT